MTSTRKSQAQVLIALALKIAPRERMTWFRAMAAEIDHIPEAKQRSFAAGCCLAATRERVLLPEFLHATVRSLLVGGALFWAALNIRFAGRMSVIDSFAVEAFAYGTALLFVVGALATARFGYRATIRLVLPLIVVLPAAAMTIRMDSSPSAMSNLYLALIVEDLAVLMVALLIAVAAARPSTTPQGLG